MPPKKTQGAHKKHTSKPPSSTQNKRKPHQTPPTPKAKRAEDDIDSSSAQSEQEILTIFRRTFSHAFTSTLPQTLREVKGHLYNRDFIKAFGSEEYLQAYVVRWSPSRALAYKRILLDTCEAVRSIFDVGKRDPNKTTEVVCIGGGAGAEVVAIAAAVRELVEQKKEVTEEEGLETIQQEVANETLDDVINKANENEPENGQKGSTAVSRLHVTAIDIASWTTIIVPLVTALREPTVPQKASFVSEELFSATFHQGDILSPPTTALITKSTTLITLLFTTNEIFTQSTSNTTAFLSNLGDRVSSGTLLMVVESAGSYSMIKVGEKEYPMPWLLDLILVGSQGNEDDSPGWRKIVAEDSNWYRLPKEGLKYPIELENMRYLVRVYQKL